MPSASAAMSTAVKSTNQNTTLPSTRDGVSGTPY